MPVPAGRRGDGRDRPNILLIVADDLGYADVGFNGAKDIRTPHIDSPGAQGVRFSQGCVLHPFCSPSRAGLLTGRYQQRLGREYNPRYDPHDEKSGLPTNQVTLADVLRQAGYVTGPVGNWHLGAVPRFHPNVRGFMGYAARYRRQDQHRPRRHRGLRTTDDQRGAAPDVPGLDVGFRCARSAPAGRR